MYPTPFSIRNGKSYSYVFIHVKNLRETPLLNSFISVAGGRKVNALDLGALGKRFEYHVRQGFLV